MLLAQVFNDYPIDGFVKGYVFKTNLADTSIWFFDDYYAKDGYSYFLVKDGNAVMGTCIFDNFKQLGTYWERTEKFFKENLKFNIKEQKKISGTGNLFLINYKKSQQIYVGEAAGVQDYVVGCGMRFAMLTGYLAAQSIINGNNYYSYYHKEILPLIKVSIANRLIIGMLGKKSYKLFFKLLENSKDPMEFLYKFYNPSLIKSLIFPLARIIYAKHLKDPRKF